MHMYKYMYIYIFTRMIRTDNNVSWVLFIFTHLYFTVKYVRLCTGCMLSTHMQVCELTYTNARAYKHTQIISYINTSSCAGRLASTAFCIKGAGRNGGGGSAAGRVPCD